MSKEGTTYISSNKIGFSISFRKSLWLTFLSMMNGILFGTFILFFDLKGIWLIILKILFAFACVRITEYVVRAMKNRNRKLTYVIAILVSLISWYSMWAMNLCDFEERDYFSSLAHPLNILILFCKVQQYEGAFFLPDALAFFLSIIIVNQDLESVIGLFCENCKSYYQSKELYFFNGESFLNELELSTPGKYHFINSYEADVKENVFDSKVTEDNSYVFISLTLYTCQKCQNDSFISVSKGIKYYELEDEKLEIHTKYEKPILQHIYIDKETADIIEEKYTSAIEKSKK